MCGQGGQKLASRAKVWSALSTPTPDFECMFEICDQQNSIDVNFLATINNIWWLCNKHNTFSTDDKSKLFLPYRYLDRNPASLQ
jgi:hypothetical protein